MTQPVHRFVYRAQCYPGQEEATVRAWRSRLEALRALQESGQLLTASVFGWGLHFFVYYEATDGSLTPDDLAGEMGGLLEIWPGGAPLRRFVPMMDIFHCGEPRSADYWRRKAPVECARPAYPLAAGDGE
ncbi:MAG: hypothetical protein HY328_14375 [Chloroflexi bacterium]|nr:hypothetical protein [Chloroflexota bacterium]